jgi:hypothetical protein
MIVTLPLSNVLILYSLFFIFFPVAVGRVVFQILQPRIGLWPRHDACDVRIDVGVAGRSLVAALLRFFPAHRLRLLLLRPRPLALAFSSSEWSSCGHSA